MPKFLILVVLIMGIHNTQAQDDLYKKAWLEKWQNSKDYLIAIAQEMPDSLYAYKPTAREMSFGEQLEHINSNIVKTVNTYIKRKLNLYWKILTCQKTCQLLLELQVLVK